MFFPQVFPLLVFSTISQMLACKILSIPQLNQFAPEIFSHFAIYQNIYLSKYLPWINLLQTNEVQLILLNQSVHPNDLNRRGCLAHY